MKPLCLTLSIIRYRSRVKWRNPGKGVAPFPTPWCSSYRKGSLQVTLDYGRQLYFYLLSNSEKGKKFTQRSIFHPTRWWSDFQIPYMILMLHIHYSPTRMQLLLPACSCSLPTPGHYCHTTTLQMKLTDLQRSEDLKLKVLVLHILNFYKNHISQPNHSHLASSTHVWHYIPLWTVVIQNETCQN